MPVILIYGVPDCIDEKDLIPLIQDIKRDVSDLRALELTPNQVTVFFPRDLVQDGLGEEIIIFVKGLFDKPGRTESVRAGLAQKLILRCSGFFLQWFQHEFLIECLLDPPFVPSSGFASKTMFAESKPSRE